MEKLSGKTKELLALAYVKRHVSKLAKLIGMELNFENFFLNWFNDFY